MINHSKKWRTWRLSYQWRGVAYEIRELTSIRGGSDVRSEKRLEKRMRRAAGRNGFDSSGGDAKRKRGNAGGTGKLFAFGEKRGGFRVADNKRRSRRKLSGTRGSGAQAAENARRGRPERAFELSRRTLWREMELSQADSVQRRQERTGHSLGVATRGPDGAACGQADEALRRQEL